MNNLIYHIMQLRKGNNWVKDWWVHVDIVLVICIIAQITDMLLLSVSYMQCLNSS